MINELVQTTLKNRKPNNNNGKNNNEHNSSYNEYNSDYDYDNEQPSSIETPFNKYIEEQRAADMAKNGYDHSKSTFENAIYTISKDSDLVRGIMLLSTSFDCVTGAGALLSSSSDIFDTTKKHSAAQYAEANEVMVSLGLEKLNLDHYYSRKEIFNELQNIAFYPQDANNFYPSELNGAYDVKINIGKDFSDSSNYTQNINNLMSLNVNDNTQIPISYKLKDSSGNITEHTGFALAKDLVFGNDTSGPLAHSNGDYSKNVSQLCQSYKNRYSTCLTSALQNERNIAKALDKLNIKNADRLSVAQIEKILSKGYVTALDGKRLNLTPQTRALFKAQILAKKDQQMYSRHLGNKRSAKIVFNKLAENTYKQSDVYQGSKKLANAYKVGRALTNATCSSVVFLAKESHKIATKTKLGQSKIYTKTTTLIGNKYASDVKFKEAKNQLKKDLKTAKGRAGRKQVKADFLKKTGKHHSLVGKIEHNLNKAALRVAPKKVLKFQSSIKRGSLRLKESRLGKGVNAAKAPFKGVGKLFNKVRSVANILNPLNLIKQLGMKLLSTIAPFLAKISLVAFIAYISPAIVVLLILCVFNIFYSVGNAIAGAIETLSTFLFGEDIYTAEEDPYGGAFGDPTQTEDGRYPYSMEDILIHLPNELLITDLKKYYNKFASKEFANAIKNGFRQESRFANQDGTPIDFTAIDSRFWIDRIGYIGCDKQSLVTTNQFLRVKEMLTFLDSTYISEMGFTSTDEINKSLFVEYKMAQGALFAPPISNEDDRAPAIVENAMNRKQIHFRCSDYYAINDRNETVFNCNNWTTYYHTGTQVWNNYCNNLIGVTKYNDMSKFIKYDYSNYIFKYKKQTGITIGSNGVPTPNYTTYTTTLDKIIFNSNNANKDNVEISTRIGCVKADNGLYASYIYKLKENDADTLVFGLELNGPSDGNEIIFTPSDDIYQTLIDKNGNSLSTSMDVSSVDLVKIPENNAKYSIGVTAFPIYTEVILPTNSSDEDVIAIVEFARLCNSSLSNPSVNDLKTTTRGNSIIEPGSISFNNDAKTVSFKMLVGYSWDATSTELFNSDGGGYICGGHTGCAGHISQDLQLVQPTLRQTFSVALQQFGDRFVEDTQFYLKDESDIIDYYTEIMEEDWAEYELPEYMLTSFSKTGLMYGNYINGLYELLSTKDEKTPFDSIVN